MIKSFASKETRRLWENGEARRMPPALRQQALDKLQMLDAAEKVETLRVPPGNRLEKLSGNRAGYWSIRVNRQFRIVFRFARGNAHDVECVDYH